MKNANLSRSVEQHVKRIQELEKTLTEKDERIDKLELRVTELEEVEMMNL